MPQVAYQGQQFEMLPDETVLDCLERTGHTVPSSCRSGVCQTCLAKALQGIPPAASQVGLRETLKQQGYFLSCLCKPETDLVIGSADDMKVGAVISELELLSPTVIALRVTPDKKIEYCPGQFFTLIREDGLSRSYSAASVPALDSGIEMHIGLMANGQMSQWLHQEARVGDRIALAGPSGSCCYTAGDPGQPLFLLGTGTGLAPLYGILRDALHHGHQGPIHLFHGSLREDGLYLIGALRAMAAEFPQFNYYPCVLEGGTSAALHVGMVDTLALETIGSLKGHKVFLCGNPTLVKQMQRRCFLAGASLRDILADAFLMSAAPAPTASS